MKPFDIKKFLTENKLTKLTNEVELPPAVVSKANVAIGRPADMAKVLLDFIDQIDDKENPSLFKNAKLDRAIDFLRDLADDRPAKAGEPADAPANEEEVEEIQHDCANHVLHEKYGHGICLEEQHTLLEDGTVTHYDVFFKEGSKTVRDIPVNELQIINSSNHGHKKRKANEAHCNEQMMRVDEAHCNEIYNKLQERYKDSDMSFKMEGKDIIVASHCNEGQMNKIVEELMKEGYKVYESHCNE